MIKKLQHRNLQTANKIRVVFQASYAIEAKLLKATDFPPLKRTLENFIESNTEFYGYFKGQDLAAVVEIKHTTQFTHIQSLVVHPDYFRLGIASKLIEFVFKHFDSELFVVETGVDNGPATKLYLNVGFIEVKQWDTEFGIRKVKFEKRVKKKHNFS
ncbi:MAG: GNAT family N-acetyltransferase [Flavobacteriaceae bacterium]|nr:GNAT family N-acetyltransferase [Flavobacteriaceae bacterium]